MKSKDVMALPEENDSDKLNILCCDKDKTDENN